MKPIRDDNTRFGGTIPYGKPASWQQPPSEEQVEEIIATLTEDDVLEIKEREDPLAYDDADEETDVLSLLQ